MTKHYIILYMPVRSPSPPHGHGRISYPFVIRYTVSQSGDRDRKADYAHSQCTTQTADWLARENALVVPNGTRKDIISAIVFSPFILEYTYRNYTFQK